MRNWTFKVGAILLILCILLAACGPTPTAEVIREIVTEVVEVEKEVTKIVEGTPVVEEIVVTEVVEKEVTRVVEVEVETVVTATPAPAAGPQRGGTVVWGDYEPNTMNPYIASEAVARSIVQLANRGLVQVQKDGTWAPVMAAEIPTLDNGGVSEDGRTITWKLRPDLVWSDGTPLTSEDVEFTWEAVSHPEGGAMETTGFGLIESVETPNELTAVVTYQEPYISWMSQFALGLLPKHATGDPADMQNWEWNRTLDPTNGPFLLDEWRAAEYMTFERNPNYYEKGKPYLDGIHYPIIVDLETQRQMLIGGENDMHHWLEDTYVVEMQNDPNINVQADPAPYVMRLQFNLSERGDPLPAPPANPHSILGDPRVREAIILAADREEITSPWIGATLLESQFYRGDFSCDLDPIMPDPEKAMALLEEAGWTDEDGDGMRECHGCMYAEEGAPLELEMTSYTGWNREDEQVILVEQLADVGIDAYIQNHEASVWYGSWNDGSPPKLGDFDMAWYDRRTGVDPQGSAEAHYASWNIASESVPGGWNLSRINDEEIDEWLAVAGSSADTASRRDAYCKIAEKLRDEIMSELIVGVYSSHAASSSRVKGWEINEQYNPYALLGWDAQNWYIEE